MVDLFSDKIVPDWNRLVEVCIDMEKFTVVSFVCGKLWIIYPAKSNSMDVREEHSVHSSIPTTPKKMSSSRICS